MRYQTPEMDSINMDQLTLAETRILFSSYGEGLPPNEQTSPCYCVVPCCGTEKFMVFVHRNNYWNLAYNRLFCSSMTATMAAIRYNTQIRGV
ncbi:hypothetical protein QMG90_09965 [Trabulsiella odontotermitis]|uniref:hypothetical protein n=1 Tax=Trabulsiella odontotermitis TaxID=379893 RepID=UPI0024B6CE55|nr:hypothetical protein [Trabulsiella odontotermitis]WHP33198.1 hypothetical protein QMG90_09965 [Trabulsiella odontotermitis]